MSKISPGTSSLATQAGIIAVLYLVGAGLFGVAGFANFSVWVVIATILTFATVPLALILSLAWESGYSRWSPAVTLAGLFAGILLLAVHTGSLLSWSDYYSNFSYERLENGNGYHNDSAFHVAIIQGILRSGYPTTSQHLEPLIEYHTLSHFFDALALLILRLDPWESYALLFFAKGTAVMLAAVYFAAKVTQNRGPVVFFIVLLGFVVTVTSNWRVIGSHGEWFPFLALTVVAPWVVEALRRNVSSSLFLLVLSGLVVVLSLGKISLGFSFACIVGFWLLFNNFRDFRIYIMGFFWVAFFVFFGAGFGGSERAAAQDRFGESWPEISGLLVLVVVAFLVARGTGNKVLQNGALAGATALLVAAGLTVFALASSTDAFYFFHGLYLSLLMLTLPFLVFAFIPEDPRQFGSSSATNPGLSTIALAMTILSVSGPVLAGATYSPFRNWEAMAVSLVATNTATYEHFNASVAPNDAWSVTKRFSSPRLSNDQEAQGFFSQMPTELSRVVKDFELSGKDPLLLLSSEDFSWLAAQAGAEDTWSMGLLVTAISGLPLVHGVESTGIKNYGFRDYGPDGLQLSRAEIETRDLCVFGRPVIVGVDIRELRFQVLCSGTEPNELNSLPRVPSKSSGVSGQG